MNRNSQYIHRVPLHAVPPQRHFGRFGDTARAAEQPTLAEQPVEPICNPETQDGFDDSLAIASVPSQKWQNLYTEEEGLMNGTIFMELNKPFYGSACSGGKTL